MRTFAFIPGQFNKAYTGIINKNKRQDSFVELFKVAGVWLFLLICGFFFLYYVNLSSTRGYFLKQANQEIATINFQYEILKTRLIDYKQQNRDTVQSSSFKRDVVHMNAEIVKIPDSVQLGFLSSQDLIN